MKACLFLRQATQSDPLHQGKKLEQKMSETSDVEKEKEKEVVVDPDSDQKNQVDDGNKGDGDKDQIFGEEVKDSQENDKSPTPLAQQEEDAIKKKYGGLLPKKPPLISKDHERAFFDSADWALGKQGAQKPKGPLEALRPKLQEIMAVTLLHLPRIKAAHWIRIIAVTLRMKIRFRACMTKTRANPDESSFASLFLS